MTRTGLFRYIPHQDLPSYLAKGWLPIADLAHHGRYSVLCWHCSEEDCEK